MEDNLQVWQNLYDNAQLRVRNLRLLDEIGVALVEALQSLEADSDAIKAYNFHMFPHLLDLAQKFVLFSSRWFLNANVAQCTKRPLPVR